MLPKSESSISPKIKDKASSVLKESTLSVDEDCQLILLISLIIILSDVGCTSKPIVFGSEHETAIKATIKPNE